MQISRTPIKIACYTRILLINKEHFSTEVFSFANSINIYLLAAKAYLNSFSSSNPNTINSLNTFATSLLFKILTTAEEVL